MSTYEARRNADVQFSRLTCVARERLAAEVRARFSTSTL